MVILSTKTYRGLVSEAAVAELLREEVRLLRKDVSDLTDAVLALKKEGHVLPLGYGEEGFGKYTMDEFETADAGVLAPGPEADLGPDPELLADIERMKHGSPLID